jgi:Ca-activated chloride channel homolog
LPGRNYRVSLAKFITPAFAGDFGIPVKYRLPHVMTCPARTVVVTMVLTALCCLSARAQFSYKTGIDVAGFTVTVVDRDGATIKNLRADDFEVREDGVAQAVTYFVAGDGDEAVPLHIGLLFDTSESMDKDLAFSRNAAIRFLKTFSTAVDFTLVEFSDDVRASRFSQSEFPRLVERIRGSKAKGRTSLYDAVSVYLGSAFDQAGRKVLVIFTDGDDTSSSRRWDEIVRLLRASDTTVYPIGFLSNRGSPRLMLQSKLMEIGRLTGGRAMFPGAMKELDAMYATIAAEIQGQYVLGYVPTNTARDGKWRKVEIKLKRPSSDRIQLRTREGYFAPVK